MPLLMKNSYLYFYRKDIGFDAVCESSFLFSEQCHFLESTIMPTCITNRIMCEFHASCVPVLSNEGKDFGFLSCCLYNNMKYMYHENLCWTQLLSSTFTQWKSRYAPLLCKGSGNKNCPYFTHKAYFKCTSWKGIKCILLHVFPEKNKNTKLLERGGDMFENLHQILKIAIWKSPTHHSQYLP